MATEKQILRCYYKAKKDYLKRPTLEGLIHWSRCFGNLDMFHQEGEHLARWESERQIWGKACNKLPVVVRRLFAHAINNMKERG